MIKFKAPHKLVIDLSKPGSFIFIRTEENIYFDVPISILDANIDTNIISIMIEIRGVKTKKLLEIKEGGNITIRGPYWNGVFGVKNIKKQKDSNVIVLARGIGIVVLNSPGTVDCPYRGCVGVILFNNTDLPYIIKHGDQIAQASIEQSNEIEWVKVNSVNELSITERADVQLWQLMRQKINISARILFQQVIRMMN